MLRHGYNDDFLRFEKNPFLGESFRVFAVGDGGETEGTAETPGGSGSDSEKPESDFEKDLLDEMRKLVVGKHPYTPEQKSEVETTWENMTREYNAITNTIQSWERRKTDTIDNFNINDPRWGVFKQKIEAEIDLLRRSGVKIPSLGKIYNKEVKDVNTNAINFLDALIEEIKKARGKALDTMEKQMQDDFDERLAWLSDQYKKNPPKWMNQQACEKAISDIKTTRQHFRKQLPGIMQMGDEFNEDRLKEYRDISDDIGKLESDYTGKITRREFKLRDVEAAFEELKVVKKTKVDAIAAQLVAGVDEVIAELEAIKAKIPASKMEELHKEKELESINKSIENLKQRKNAPAIYVDALFSDVVSKGPDGKEIQWEFGGKKFPAKKGLYHQMQILKDPALSPEEKANWATSLYEAFEKCKGDMESLQGYLDEDLGFLKEKVKEQRVLIEAPMPSGQKWKVTWLAPHDIMRAVEIIQDWAKTRHDRNSSARVGKAGSEALKMLKHVNVFDLNTLPNEFDRKVENSEQETVNKYKEIYGNKDAWQVEEIAYNCRNQDELKACMYLLAEKGRIRWDRPQLWKQFNRFQKKVQFTDNVRAEMRDIGAFYDKLREAIGAIYDYDTFNNWRNTNSSSYESEKEKHKAECDQWAEMASADGTTGLSSMAADMLQKYTVAKAKGEDAKIDPTVYEKIIHYAMDNGKMGSEEKMYYLIQGIACGLLAPDRGSALNSAKINDYPVIDYFGSPTKRGGKPTLKDIQEVASNDGPPESFKPGPMFLEWFHNEGMTRARVTQRIDKTLTQGNKLDHDDLTAFLPYMGEETAETMLKSFSDGFRLPQTGVQNGTVSFLFYMDNMAENYDRMMAGAEVKPDVALQKFIGMFTRYDAILRGKMYRESNQYFRWNSTSYNEVPRSDGAYKGMYGRDTATGLERPMTSKDNMQTVQSYLKILDPEFFGKLYGEGPETDAEAKAMADAARAKHDGADVFDGEDPNTIDKIYKSSGTYAGFIIREKPELVQRMFARIKEDHKKVFENLKSKGEKTMEDLREEHTEQLRKVYQSTRAR